VFVKIDFFDHHSGHLVVLSDMLVLFVALASLSANLNALWNGLKAVIR